MDVVFSLNDTALSLVTSPGGTDGTHLNIVSQGMTLLPNATTGAELDPNRPLFFNPAGNATSFIDRQL